MRALLLSDIHANIDALRAALADAMQRWGHFDETWVAGDLVDYGAAPDEVIDWVRRHASVVVRGNHDHAMGTGEDCRSSPAYHALSVATRDVFRPRLSPDQREYLARLPLSVERNIEELGRCLFVHATPNDPLFTYVPHDAPFDTWQAVVQSGGAPSLMVLGHTHEQFARTVGTTRIVNPGSVGLPKDGDPRAAYAVIDGGDVTLYRTPYDVRDAVRRIEALPLSPEHRRRLTTLIETATLPS